MHINDVFTWYYSTILFLAILHISSGVLLSPLKVKENFSPDGPSIRPHPIPNHNLLPQCAPQYIVTPQLHTTSGAIYANVPSVTLFTNKFHQAVHNMDMLREVLDLSQTTAKQYADFIREYSKDILRKLGVENDSASAISEFTSRAITPNFNILTLPTVAKAFCNSAANFLLVNGALELHNAEDLALLYAKSLVDSAKIYMNSDPTSKFPSLTNGYVNFFESIGLFTKTKAQLLAYYIGNEWTLAAINYGWLS